MKFEGSTNIKPEGESEDESKRKAGEMAWRGIKRGLMEKYLRDRIVELRKNKGLPDTATWEEIIEADRKSWERILEEFHMEYSDVDEETRIEIIASVLGEFTRSRFSEEARRKLFEYILNPEESFKESPEESQNE